MQAETIREQRCNNVIMVAWQTRKVHITVDNLVTEMLQNLPVESVCEITHLFEVLKGESWVPDAWRVFRLVFSKKEPTTDQKVNADSVRIALLSVLPKWFFRF